MPLWLFIIGLTFFSACKLRKGDSGYVLVKATIHSDSATKRKSEINSISNTNFTPLDYTSSNKTNIKYRLLIPLDDKTNKRYPLVLVLHGSGAIGTDNTAQLGLLAKLWAQPGIRKKYPAYIVAPQFTVRSSSYTADADNHVLASVAGPSLSSVLELIDSLKKVYPVDSKRIYIIGLSMGASATINALGLRPDLFAAAVAISGIPDFKHLGTLAKTPIWFIHGNADTENPIASDAALLKKLQALHASKIRYWEIDSLQHEIYPELYTDDALPNGYLSKKVELNN